MQRAAWQCAALLGARVLGAGRFGFSRGRRDATSRLLALLEIRRRPNAGRVRGARDDVLAPDQLQQLFDSLLERGSFVSEKLGDARAFLRRGGVGLGDFVHLADGLVDLVDTLALLT